MTLKYAGRKAVHRELSKGQLEIKVLLINDSKRVTLAKMIHADKYQCCVLQSMDNASVG